MPSEPIPPRYAGIKQAAATRGISYRTLLCWIDQGLVQAYRFGPRLLQVDLNELDALRVPVDLAARGDRAQAKRQAS